MGGAPSEDLAEALRAVDGEDAGEFRLRFSAWRAQDKGKIELLATCEIAKRRDNVLLLGPPDVAKTHLVAGLGIRAIQNGSSVALMSANELIEQLRRDAAGANRRIRRRKYMNTSVVIIDELGLQAFARRDAHLPFKVISFRHERGSTPITSNKSIREWPEMLAGDDALATAILDRLLHHCHVVQTDGRSFRLREIEKQIGEEQRGSSAALAPGLRPSA